MTQISKEALYNICKTIFKYLNRDDLKRTAETLVRLLDISINFDDLSIYYYVDVDNKIEIKLTDAEKNFPFRYKTTYYKLSPRDVIDLETILNDNDNIASSYYPLFDCFGYVLIRDSYGKWKLLWKIDKY